MLQVTIHFSEANSNISQKEECGKFLKRYEKWAYLTVV
jgi:hypothetical protein